jgi:hypothetical protein
MFNFTNRTILLSLLWLTSLGLAAAPLHAAVVFVEPTQRDGAVYHFRLMLDPEGESVNALEGTLVVRGGGFSSGGDSGSLVVTNDGRKNPVGLLFAGSVNTTIINPIEPVLALLSEEVGSDLTIDGK